MLIAILVGLTDAFARTAEPANVRGIVVAEAELGGLPASLALAVAHVESNFQHRAISPAGARGVMQIMPATAERLFGVDPDELWDARLNVQLGVSFLGDLIRKYGGRWDLALSHYNAGSIERAGAETRPLARARGYVAEVLKWERHYARPELIASLAEPDRSDGWAAANAAPSPRRLADSRPVTEARVATPETAIISSAGSARWGAPLPDEPESRRMAIRSRLADFTRVATIRDVVP